MKQSLNKHIKATCYAIECSRCDYVIWEDDRKDLKARVTSEEWEDINGEAVCRECIGEKHG